MDQINQDNYRAFPAVSNSDLVQLHNYWMPQQYVIDLTTAYANGTLVDAMLTESHRVDYFKYRVQGEDYQFSPGEFERAKEMKKAALKDPLLASMLKSCAAQHITYNPDFKITYEGFTFSLPGKCKWDLYHQHVDLSGDIKTTACTTQKQVEEAARHFNYDQSRAWYMDLPAKPRNNDILIFISKENFKVFKVPVKRDSQLYKDGKKKYEAIAFKQWCLFGEVPQHGITPAPDWFKEHYTI